MILEICKFLQLVPFYIRRTGRKYEIEEFSMKKMITGIIFHVTFNVVELFTGHGVMKLLDYKIMILTGYVIIYVASASHFMAVSTCFIHCNEIFSCLLSLDPPKRSDINYRHIIYFCLPIFFLAVSAIKSGYYILTDYNLALSYFSILVMYISIYAASLVMIVIIKSLEKGMAKINSEFVEMANTLSVRRKNAKLLNTKIKLNKLSLGKQDFNLRKIKFLMNKYHNLCVLSVKINKLYSPFLLTLTLKSFIVFTSSSFMILYRWLVGMFWDDMINFIVWTILEMIAFWSILSICYYYEKEVCIQYRKV